MRYWLPQEVKLVVELAGFKVLNIYGDAGRNFSSREESIWVLAEK